MIRAADRPRVRTSRVAVRFSVRQLLVFVAFVALACAGLIYPTKLVASMVFTVAIAVLLVAVLAAVAVRGPARFFWIGAAVTGWGYFWLAHWPDEDQYLIKQVWRFQTEGPLLTTKMLRWTFDTLHPATETPDGVQGTGGTGGGFFSLPAEKVPSRVVPSLPSTVLQAQFGSGGGGKPPTKRADFDTFMRIGHCLWTLILAYLGGLLTRYLYQTSSRSV